MKLYILLAISLPVATLAVAQQPSISAGVKQKLEALRRPLLQPKGPMVHRLPAQDTGKAGQYRKLLEAQRWQKGGLVTATYSHTTPRGKVYTLTPDNMPCLVPDRKAVAAMPNADSLVIMDDRWNALPRQRIIPREEGKNNK